MAPIVLVAYVSVSIVVLAAVACSRPEPTTPEVGSAEDLDAVQAKCFAERLYPNQSLWAQVILQPDCDGESKERYVEQIFSLGVLSYPYASLMAKFGAAAGAAANPKLSQDQKSGLEVEALEFWALQEREQSARLTSFMQQSNRPCTSGSVMSGIFSSGYTCASLYATEARASFVDPCRKFCRVSRQDREFSECDQACEAAYSARRLEQAKIIGVYNRTLRESQR